MLLNGEWHDSWYETKDQGRFNRQQSSFRAWIVAPDQFAATGQGFKAEAGRYHLYVSLACPWAHRVLIFRQLKGLAEMISASTVDSHMGSDGWTFADNPDPLYGLKCAHQLYTKCRPKYSGRVTVPILWDKREHTIVNNESSEIIRMLNSAFDHLGARQVDFYPVALRDEINTLNRRIYHTVNNGVYKAGFASSQQAYEEAVFPLFDSLEWLDQRLSEQRYLCGARLTEADWRLFTTLIRFDWVYHGHFKCNLKRLVDYEHLWGYTLELAQQPGVAETINRQHIIDHYYGSHPQINPTAVRPIGPTLDLTEPHHRGHLRAISLA